MDGRSDVFLAVVGIAATAGHVIGRDAASAAGPGEVAILRKSAPIHNRPFKTPGKSGGEPTPHRTADFHFAEERSGSEAMTVSPLGVLAPIIEGEAVLPLPGIRLRFVPIGEFPALSVDPAKLSFPLDVGGADPKFLFMTERAGDSPLRNRIRDDRQLASFVVANVPGAIPVGLLRVIQIRRAASDARQKRR